MVQARARTAAVSLSLAALTGFMTFSPIAANEDARIQTSSEYAARLQAELGSRLKAAIADGGPVAAIEVCRVEAPRIAHTLSRENPAAKVGRTALRVRNPANAPDAHARMVLEQFEAGLANGEDLPLTDFTVFPDGSARYMQSIMMQPMCVACHGPALAEEVEAAIAEHYPEDEATGFAPGELRGAFIVEWPPEAADK